MTGNALKCSLCSEKFNCSRNLNAHIQLQHAGFRDIKKKNIKCNMCDYELCTTKSLISHMRTHTGERPFKCTINDCGTSFKLKTTLNNHIKYKHSDERVYECNLPGCRYTAKTSSNLLEHQKVHSVERPFPCPNAGCSFRAKSMSRIKFHVKCVHSEAKANACSMCDYKTARAGNLKQHMRRHSATRDFKCSQPHCTDSFKRLNDLRIHFSNRHRDKNMDCDHPGCGRKYANSKALNDHRRVVHSKKSHACSHQECSYRTNKASHLASHMVVHEGRNQKIPCSMEGCDYKGSNSKALEAHIRRHKIPCPVTGCGRHASSKEALKDHIELHNSLGRPFTCPLCSKHFQTLQNLQGHCVVHTNEKPLKCGHCEFAAVRQTNIKRHISSVHPSIAFPFIVHLPDGRECLHCQVTMPSAEFISHSNCHVGPVLMK